MMILQKFKILSPLQKLPKNVRDLGKSIAAKGFEKLPKVQISPNLVTLVSSMRPLVTIYLVAFCKVLGMGRSRMPNQGPCKEFTDKYSYPKTEIKRYKQYCSEPLWLTTLSHNIEATGYNPVTLLKEANRSR